VNRVSRVTGGVIKHPLLERARDEYIPLCRDATDGIALALLGPTQCGKSVIFNEVVPILRTSFKDERPGSIPIVGLQVETVSEGRTKPKWIGIELLKELHHPIYKHIGALDENDHYFPSKGRDESTLRIALKEAFQNRFTRRVCLDEAHLLTRTRDPELRAAILESIKSTCAIERSLIACGGYEMAYKGLFDSSHFCGRVIHFDFGNYSKDVPADVETWARILKTYSVKLDLKPRTLLVDETVNLLYWNNGTLGLLDKHLWKCSMLAKARHQPIDAATLRACAPPEKERRSIALDIRKGREALRSSSEFPIATPEPRASEDQTASQSKRELPNQKRAPFERNPRRNAAMEVTLHDDD